MAVAPLVTPVDAFGTPLGSTGGSATATIAAAAGTVVIKAGAGRLCRVVVTAAPGGTGAITFYDSASAASGTVVGVIPSTTTVGSVVDFQIPVTNGIVASAATGSAAATVSYV